MIEIRRDYSGKEYAEIEAGADEHVRVTLVPAAGAGYGMEALRLQIRQAVGMSRPGPDLPVAAMAQLLAAAWSLGVAAANAEQRADVASGAKGVKLPSHDHQLPSIDKELYKKLCEVARAGQTVDYTTVFGDPNEAPQSGRPFNWARDHDAGHFGHCDTRVLLPSEDELAFVVRQRKAVDQLWKP